MKLYVKVKPNSSNKKITLIKDQEYLVELKSVAEKNKANIELIKLLAKHLSISSKNITIKAGLSNKNKIIEVKNEI